MFIICHNGLNAVFEFGGETESIGTSSILEIVHCFLIFHNGRHAHAWAYKNI